MLPRAWRVGIVTLALACAGESMAFAQAVSGPALQPFVDRGEIAGAVVLIADRDSILEHEAIGYADMATKQAMPKDALFWLASTAKVFAGTAVMMLVEEGKLDLDAPVSTYLPGFAPGVAVNPDEPGTTATRPTERPVTLRMLLTHTSGMYSGSPADAPTLDAVPLAERVASYGRLLQFQPGTRFWYGNADINTAGYVVERVSGMPYAEFLRTRLFEPLGMTRTSACPTEAALRTLPTYYSAPPEGSALVAGPIPQMRYPLSDCANRYAIPGGDTFSTATDLARFVRMLLNGGTLDGKRYLTQASIDAMTRNQLTEEQQSTVPGAGPPDYISYGLGWGASLDGSYFHPGLAMTDIRVDPTHRVATIVLMQTTSPASFPARAEVIKASDARYARREPSVR